MAGLALRGVRKSFGDLEVVHGVDLDIADREFVVFVGPSGCGKSTLLRMIAGLEEITSGEISIGGRVVNELDPRDRDIAMVFQDYALYPHMTVFENMAFSLRYRGVAKDEIRRRVDEAARILEIEPLVKRMLEREDVPVIIQADIVAQSGLLVRAIDEAKLGGATKVSVATRASKG